jgi:hypothetical protein
MEFPKFNTDDFQNYPDYFYKEPDQPLQKKNNNTRYKYFRQTHFTAGDEDQFLEFWDRSTPIIDPNMISTINFNENILVHVNIKWNKYRNLCSDNVINTYHYISEKFKKGIFLKITDGKAKVFLPFSKIDYQNEWSDKIKVNPKKFENVIEMMRYTAKMEDREFVESRIHKNTKAWYGNNGLVRLEFPISEGDNGVNILKDMFTTLIKERNLPSCELFLNKRDFPLLKKDDTESYNTFFGNRTKLLSHLYPKYAPILSMTTSELHADIPIPTWEDWMRVAYWSDKKLFSKEFRKFPFPEEFDNIPWEQKKPIAVFRGASTGLGTTIENNIRLTMSAESVKNIKDGDGIKFLNVGITKWNLRPRKHPSYPYLETIHIDKLPFDLVKPLTPLEQAEYKYLLHLPGHSEAYRLGYQMFFGSVILYYPCEYQVWFFKWMKPWVHYVPLSGSIDDIYDKIKWCKNNDEKCKEIVKNAKIFANTYLTKDGILDYLHKTLWHLYTHTNKITYCPRNIIDINMELYNTYKTNRNRMNELIKKNEILYDNLNDCISAENIQLSNDILEIIFSKNIKNLENQLELIKDGRTTQIYKFSFNNKSFAIKKSKKTWKLEEKFQIICGIYCINQLTKNLPNFVYTYYDYMTDDISNTIIDYIDGNTLEKYISDPKFTIHNLFDIFISVTLAISEAQQYCGFLHMDLYPWNIMIKEQTYTCQYNLDNGSCSITSNILPIIIDYGKSHFIYNGQHYYNTTPFHLCRLQDIISIVFSSVFLYIENKKLNDKEIKIILQLMNFFSNSEYLKNSYFYNLSQLKSFLKKHKKYSNMLKEQKLGLEDKSPLDFFKYLIQHKFPYHSKISFHESKKTLCNDNYWINMSASEYELKLKKIEIELLSIFPHKYNNIDLRKLWIQLENFWNCKFKTSEEYFIHHYNLSLLFDSLINYFESLSEKIWKNLSIIELKKDFPSVPNISFYIYDENPSTLIKLPIYPTHLCRNCISKNFHKLSKPQISFIQIFLQNLIKNLKKESSIDVFPYYIISSNHKTIQEFLKK